jgi:hypothetical protein
VRYLDYEASRDVANIVVDGSPNESTVLALSHWPGIPAPPGLARDLSAEMAFAYLDATPDHAPAEIVTNNHFDQDGLVSIHALIEPELSLAHRELRPLAQRLTALETGGVSWSAGDPGGL